MRSASRSTYQYSGTSNRSYSSRSRTSSRRRPEGDEISTTMSGADRTNFFSTRSTWSARTNRTSGSTTLTSEKNTSVGAKDLPAMGACIQTQLDHQERYGPLVPRGRRRGHDELPVDELTPEVGLRGLLEVVVREAGRRRLGRHRSPPSMEATLARGYDISIPGGPVLDCDLLHWEVTRVAGGEEGSDAGGRRSHQAVGLRQRDPSPGEVPAPATGRLTLTAGQWCDPQPVHEPLRGALLPWPKAADHFLDIDGARVGTVARPSEGSQPFGRGAPPKRVDEHGGVEQDRAHRSPDAPGVAPSLPADPCGGIVVPLVPLVRHGSERRLDLVPPALVVQGPSNRFRDTGAPAPPAHPLVKLGDQCLVQAYVHTHGHNVAHTLPLQPNRPPAPVLSSVSVIM